MSLLLSASDLDARRAIAAGALRPLSDGLLAELAPVLDDRVEIPREKALLSRAGGRCPHDGSLLLFDPLDPRHICPRCGAEVAGELHDRFRPYWMQLWIAERVLHAALLGNLLGDDRCTAAAWRLLDEYAERYLTYPNRDNVLGPSRPFFSTYLESIWLLQLVLALDLLESSGDRAATTRGGRIRDRVVEPSIGLVASYDEGLSNRQVWNNAALVAAGTLLSRRELVDRALEGASGLRTHLEHALLGDGSWYEGENYHLFAHRGLWYAMTIAEQLGRAPEAALRDRFDDGFVSPFRTLLPDLTYPSRRDSQYGVSVRQPRFAESCELGLARRDDPRLVGMLARLYDPAIERRETGRRASTADVERNLPATGLTRADLSWRALLFAREQLPPLLTRPFVSDLLPAQGFGILRREDGRIFVGLDYGHSGGGHGHPDRLNLLLSDGGVRWFDDPGTGSYVEESLHWYRSTLAHTAPLLDGRSQPRVHGALSAFDDRGTAGWISAHAVLAGDCDVRRSVVVLHDYLVDRVEWSGRDEHELALPLHGVTVLSTDGEPLVADPSPIEGGPEREDGFSFLRETGRLPVVDDVIRLRAESSGTTHEHRLDGWVATSPRATWWSARAPGAPGHPEQSLVLPRVRGRAGELTAVWSWRDAVTSVVIDGDAIRVSRADGTTDVHRRHEDGWAVSTGGDASIVLRGAPEPDDAESSGVLPGAPRALPPMPLPLRLELGAVHFRGSEESWEEADRPRAGVAIERNGASLDVSVIVPKSARQFIPIDQENPLDNDPAAIHGDGVQIYVDAGDRAGGWLLVPVAGTEGVGMRVADGWSDDLTPRATWRPTDGGYRLDASIPLPRGAGPLAIDVLVNVSGPGRTRRRGQLVLSGARGEFVYLRSDRHDRERLVPLMTD